MSASLVGSEMCIRDRPRRSSASCAVAAARPGRARAAVFRSRVPARSEHCLLYTSDAADDM
eukprot:12642055-Alexandrium_andersonii.AAC.1